MPIDPIKIILQCTGPRASRRDLADYKVMYEYDIKKPVSGRNGEHKALDPNPLGHLFTSQAFNSKYWERGSR